MDEDGVFGHKIDYVAIFKDILNLEGQYWLLNGWILPTGGVSSIEGLRSTGLPRLVFSHMVNFDFRKQTTEPVNFQSIYKSKYPSVCLSVRVCV